MDYTGQKLWELRRRRGLTQDELGAQLKVDGRQISRYENGKVRPSKKVMAKFCEFFNVTPEFFVEPENEAIGEIQDKELYQQFLALDRMDSQEKEALKVIINAVLTKYRAQKFFLQEAG